MLTRILLILTLTLATFVPVHANQVKEERISVHCFPADFFLAKLKEHKDESLVWAGKAETGAFVLTQNIKTKTWTVFHIDSTGSVVCLIAMGELSSVLIKTGISI